MNRCSTQVRRIKCWNRRKLVISQFWFNEDSRIAWDFKKDLDIRLKCSSVTLCLVTNKKSSRNWWSNTTWEIQVVCGVEHTKDWPAMDIWTIDLVRWLSDHINAILCLLTGNKIFCSTMYANLDLMVCLNPRPYNEFLQKLIWTFSEQAFGSTSIEKL